MQKLIGKGRLPKPENLKNLDVDQLRKVLQRFGIDATEIRNQMLREFSRPAGRLAALKRQGIKADQALLNQLKGQIKRTRTSLERRMTGKAIVQFQTERNKILYKDKLSKRIWIWICAFKNSCDSCIPRHNVVKSYNEWQRIGMPKSDVLICDGNCNCNIIIREDIEGIKIESSPDNLEDLRTRQRTKKEVKQVKQEIQGGYFEKELEKKLNKNIDNDKKTALIITAIKDGKISEGQADKLIKKYFKKW